MKVAILTLPLHTNYGGNIQAFALQKVLKRMGHEPVTINYRRGMASRNIVFRLLSKVKYEIIRIRDGLGYQFTEEEKIAIGMHHGIFINGHINYSLPLYNDLELREFVENEGIEAVIVGSDQVWRPKYTPNIKPFFLSFLQENNKLKKIAYAASFGSDVWEYTVEQTNYCSNLLKDFTSISVRESLGVDMCKEYFNTSVEHVLDPTLLLDKDAYISIFDGLKLPDNKGGIFNYVLDSDKDKDVYLQKVSILLNKEVFSTYPKRTVKNSRAIVNIEDYKFPPVEAWLKSFYDADFVITDSFHGTVFSIIFNKPFVAICNTKRGAARFYSLLKMFNLENRLISDFSNVNLDVFSSDIDFDVVNTLLNDAKNKSIEFISKSLSK